MTTHLCFVYGSLLRGEANHRLLQRARFVRAARTSPVFTMVDLGAFPGILAGGTTAIAGEVYEVDEDTLRALDRLEGHPTFYRRHEVELDDRSFASAYLLPAPRLRSFPAVTSGSWLEHRARACEDGRGRSR